MPAHPFVAAYLRRAIHEFLKDRHGHLIPQEILACVACSARLWECLGRAAPLKTIRG